MPSTIRGSDNFDSGQKLTQGTAVSTVSGTAVDFTGIPAWAKRITVMFNGVSTSGANNVQVQIGSGSIDSTGYASSGSLVGLNSVLSQASTSGLLVTANWSATYAISGVYTLTLCGTNTWVASGCLGLNSNGTLIGGGTKTLTGTLDRIRITTVGGTDTFDAGSINILYE